MAREIREYAVPVPAGTALAAPATTALVMPARIVRRVRVRVPPGPNGLLGFALASSGVNIIPWGPGQWFVANDEVFTWDLEGQIDSGAWQLRAYNTGAYAHTLYLTFELDPPQLPAIAGTSSAGMISGLDLSQLVPPGSDGGPEPVPPPGDGLPPEPPPADGYATAKYNAEVAVLAAFGLEVPGPALPPPPLGSVAGVAYDAGRSAAVAALGALAPTL